MHTRSPREWRRKARAATVAAVALTGACLVACGKRPAGSRAPGIPPAYVVLPEETGRVDALGDPLPEFALARCGTSRLRPSLSFERIEFTPGGREIVTAGLDGITFWDARTGREVRRLEFDDGANCDGFAMSPDGRGIAVGAEPGILIVDAVTGAVGLAVETGGPGSADRCAFSPDGKRLAAAWDEMLPGMAASRGRVGVFDARTGAELASAAFADNVWCLAFGGGGRLIAVETLGDSLVMLDAATGKELWRRDAKAYELAFSPDGSRLLTVDQAADEARLWDAATGEMLRKVDASAAALNRQTGELIYGDLVDPPDERWRTRIMAMDLASGETRALPGAEVRDRVQSIAVSRGGDLMACSAEDWAVVLYDLAAGRRLDAAHAHTGWVDGVALSPDGRTVLTGGSDGTARLWDAATGKPMGKSAGLWGCVHAVAFAPDGRPLAFGDDRTAWVIVDAATGRRELAIERPGRQGGLGQVVFSRDCARFAARAYEQPLRVYDSRTGKVIAEFDPAEEIALSPDGRRLAAGGRSSEVLVYDIDSGGVARRLVPPPAKDHDDDDVFPSRRRRIWFSETTALTFSPDGSRLASGHGSGMWHGFVLVWDIREDGPPQALEGAGGGVESLAFSPDGKVLAAGDGSGDVCLWDTARGELALRLVGHLDSVESLAFGASGRRLVSGGTDTTAVVWDVDGALAKAARERAAFDEPRATRGLQAYLFRREIARDLARGRERTYFLSAGEDHDPPGEVLAGLQDLPARIMMASELKTDEDEMVVDPETGAEGVVLCVEVLRWLVPGEVVVTVSHSMGPLAGGGETVQLSWRNGRWLRVAVMGGWIS